MLEIVKNLSRPELGVFSNKEDLSNKEPLDILNVSFFISIFRHSKLKHMSKSSNCTKKKKSMPKNWNHKKQNTRTFMERR